MTLTMSTYNNNNHHPTATENRSAQEQTIKKKKNDNLASYLAKENRTNQSFWKTLCPFLSISGSIDNNNNKESSLSSTTATTSNNSNFKDEHNKNDNISISETIKKPTKNQQQQQKQNQYRRKKLMTDGYVLVDEPLISSKDEDDNNNDIDLIQTLRNGITELHVQHQLPATFILLFDETWELAKRSKTMLKGACHENNQFNFDLLAWYIEPGSCGFSPHRDRQPSDAASTFHPPISTSDSTTTSDTSTNPNRDAKFVTQWIALSDATPQNSCLYVIPKQYDPGYMNGDDDNQDPLQRALPTKESFQQIRALPRKAGQSILFTHRIIHWGSASDDISMDSDDDDNNNNDDSVAEAPAAGQSRQRLQPRIAISFVCSDPSYEPPLLVKAQEYFSDTTTTTTTSTLPPFHIRLLLICAQLLIYYQRFELSKDAIKLCYEYCKEYQDELDESYRQKVFYEFVKAMKEEQQKQVQQEDESTTPTITSTPTSSKEVKLIINGKATNGNDNMEDNDDDDDDDDDAVMEEMLNAERGGYGEFKDDYDELDDDDDEDDISDCEKDGRKNEDDGHGEEDDDEDDDEEEEFDLDATFVKQSKDVVVEASVAPTTNNGSNSNNSPPPAKKIKTN